MGYLYLLMGVIISPAVIPATLTLLWSQQSWAAATFAPLLGFACSIMSWLVATQAIYGELTVETTGSNRPMLVGNIVALLSPVIFIPILTYCPPFTPQKYDWLSMLNIRVADDRDIIEGDPEQLQEVIPPPPAFHGDDKTKLEKSAKTARWLCLSLTISILVLWPMPLYGTGYVFSRNFFTGWVVVGFLWLFLSCGVVVFLPVFESRSTILRTSSAIYKDLLALGGKRAPVMTHGKDGEASGTSSPPRLAVRFEEKM